MVDYRDTEGYRQSLYAWKDEYYDGYEDDLIHHIAEAKQALVTDTRRETLTLDEFVNAIGTAYAAIERFVNADRLRGFTFPEVLKMRQAEYKWLLEQLDQLDYSPEGIKRALQILNQAKTCIPRNDKVQPILVYRPFS